MSGKIASRARRGDGRGREGRGGGRGGILSIQPIGRFRVCFELHYKSEAKCKTFHVKISFVCI